MEKKRDVPADLVAKGSQFAHQCTEMRGESDPTNLRFSSVG